MHISHFCFTKTEHESSDWLLSCTGRGLTGFLLSYWLVVGSARSGRGLTVACLSVREVVPYIELCPRRAS